MRHDQRFHKAQETYVDPFLLGLLVHKYEESNSLVSAYFEDRVEFVLKNEKRFPNQQWKILLSRLLEFA